MKKQLNILMSFLTRFMKHFFVNIALVKEFER